MGVNNLTGFIETNPKLTIENFKLRDTKLIIDASNIKHQLHQASSRRKNDNVFGGDLKTFAETVQRFLKRLKLANLEPIFVCDGAKDITIHDKTQEQFGRAKTMFSATQRVYEERAGLASQVRSDNLSNVYKSIISETGHEIHSCMFEADDQIARLSNHHEAPILSHDTDFYLMDLKFGVIGFSPIHFLRNRRDRFISCNLYKRDHFVKSFPGLDEQCLPLLGVLVGNDFVSKDKFIRMIERHADFKKISVEQWSSKNPRHERILKVLYFLCHKTPEMAINQIMMTYETDAKRVEIKDFIIRNIQFYDIPSDENQFEAAIANIYKWATEEQVEAISNHLRNYLKYNSSDLLELLHKTCLFMRPIIDDFEQLRSSRACSYEFYGVVLRLLRCDDSDYKPFSLYDRLGYKYCEHIIHPIDRLPNYGKIKMNIDDILTTPPKSRLRLLLATLRSSFLRFDEGLKYYQMWFTYENAIQASYIKLLLDYTNIMDPLKRCTERFKRAIYTTFIYYVYKLDHIYQRYGSTDILEEIDRNRLREPLYNSGYCMIIIHWITRFAATIEQFNMLNSLLGEPIEKMRIHHWFNACLIYNLTLETWEADRSLHRHERAQLAFF